MLLTSRAHATQHRSNAGQSHDQPAPADLQDFQEAQMLLQQGRIDEARASVQQVLKRKPSSVEGYNLLGIIDSSEKNYPNALNDFQSALKIAPLSPRTHNNLGNVYIAQGRIDLAEQEFRTVLRIDPTNADGNYNLGVLLIGRGFPAEAIRRLERVRPASLPVRFNLIRAYLQAKRTATALTMAAELSAQNKTDVQLHFTLGVLLAAEKQYKPAQSELEIADSLAPGTFEILYNLGRAYLRDGKFNNAELATNRALKAKPDSPETLYLLAQIYSDESRPLDALDILVRAHKIAPEDPDVIFLMARVSISQNYFEDAIPLLESGVKIAPRRADLQAALGESYFMSGKVEKAIDQFQKLVTLDPSARSYAFLGLSYRNLGRFDEAVGYFKKGLQLDANNTSCLYNLGFIAERQGDSTAAEAFFQQILRTNPDYPDALLEMANIRIAAKDLPHGAELLRRYVKVSREPSTGYYKLAMVERQLHQTEAADRDLKVFQTLSKDASTGPYPYEHLFDYLDNRSRLAPGARNELDLTVLSDEIKKHPDQPEDLYLLAEAYLKAGKTEEARETIADLDKLTSGDYRTQTGVGVLLARYRLYDDAIQHFQAA
ncbi:MAG TPA: tetratricopeptide repeat protein, partial [Acidisarcina sp.]